MKRVLFTEEQIAECLRRSIKEQTYYMSDGKNQTPDKIASDAKAENPGAGSDDSVATPLSTVAGCSGMVGADKATADIQLSEGYYTKKQIKEAKLRYLKENSYSVRKKDLK